MKTTTIFVYILRILFIVHLLCFAVFAEEHTIPPELQKGKKVGQQAVSLWLGGDLGVYFVSDDIHDYLKKQVRNDPLNLYVSLSVKACLQFTPFSWLNFQTVAGGGSGVNYSGNLLRKHPLHKAMFGILPGFAFRGDDSHYMLNAGVFVNYFAFHDETDYGIGYRVKLSMVPFVNDLLDFPTVRGTITIDYTYGNNNDFNLGQWGFQVGFEVLVW